MDHRIARVFEQLLRPLFPVRVRHRAADPPFTTYIPAKPKAVARPFIRTAPALRGADSTAARPRAHELRLREEERLRRQRRRDLWFATYGIDLDTRDIHRLGVV